MPKRFIAWRPFSIDVGLLFLRVVTASFMLLGHGWPKLSSYSERLHKFSNPLGLGSEVSLTLAVFAEFFCSLFLILGLFTRLALIPLMVTMSTAAFVVHTHDPFNKKELPLLYLTVFLVLLFTGPGKYSIDALRYRGK